MSFFLLLLFTNGIFVYKIVVDSGYKCKKVVIKMLMGEFHHNIDEKMRLIIPSKFRFELGEEIVITRGMEGCLFVYSLKEWEVITNKLKALPFTKRDARNFMRLFSSGATICEFDKQGRIVIPKNLKTYAELEKECVVLGVGDRLEIWSSSNWDNFFNENKENLSDLADHLFDQSIGE